MKVSCTHVHSKWRPKIWRLGWYKPAKGARSSIWSGIFCHSAIGDTFANHHNHQQEQQHQSSLTTCEALVHNCVPHRSLAGGNSRITSVLLLQSMMTCQRAIVMTIIVVRGKEKRTFRNPFLNREVQFDIFS